MEDKCKDHRWKAFKWSVARLTRHSAKPELPKLVEKVKSRSLGQNVQISENAQMLATISSFDLLTVALFNAFLAWKIRWVVA